MQKAVRVDIIGAGILGLAHAYTYAKRGHRVRVFERSLKASGASIRNFGMIWPIGQPAGVMSEMAALSRRLWLEVLNKAELTYAANGALHLAYHDDEEAVAREFAEREPQRGRWIDTAAALERSPAIVARDLRGALRTEQEIVVDPRQVIARIPKYLAERHGVEFRFGIAVSEVPFPESDLTIICSGADFESLYPEVFEASGLTRCKLQMMRTSRQPSGWLLGPALAAGLTLRFYPSFASCESIGKLRRRVAETMPDYDALGIHVMVSQMPDGTLTIGDSHEYGLAVDVFNKEVIDGKILEYLATFAHFPNMEVSERWYGVYAKHPEEPYFVFEPEPGVRIITGVGGAGMTLSFGLAETLYG